ncbi:uncharacterized protein LOC126683176 [Mercurialis annua]|uniref:uncharacterized protein LOC126683176 n=1 Tax=Mercurialis annua TaxID=3986 RepID=UPI00215E9045|nr:uncharacterized protein LOC126683176 [Mercurialis annua]
MEPRSHTMSESSKINYAHKSFEKLGEIIEQYGLQGWATEQKWVTRVGQVQWRMCRKLEILMHLIDEYEYVRKKRKKLFGKSPAGVYRLHKRLKIRCLMKDYVCMRKWLVIEDLAAKASDLVAVRNRIEGCMDNLKSVMSLASKLPFFLVRDVCEYVTVYGTSLVYPLRGCAWIDPSSRLLLAAKNEQPNFPCLEEQLNVD